MIHTKPKKLYINDPDFVESFIQTNHMFLANQKRNLNFSWVGIYILAETRHVIGSIAKQGNDSPACSFVDFLIPYACGRTDRCIKSKERYRVHHLINDYIASAKGESASLIDDAFAEEAPLLEDDFTRAIVSLT